MKRVIPDPFAKEIRYCKWCAKLLPDEARRIGIPSRHCNKSHRQFWNQRNWLNNTYSRLQDENRHV